MTHRKCLLGLAALLLVNACSDEPETPAETEQSATASGDVLGGAISDDMLPLEELRSQSPPAPRATTRTTTVTETEAGTSVETTVTTTTGEEGPPPPEPPAPPADGS